MCAGAAWPRIAGAPETAVKRFQIMKEIMPQAKRAAVLWNPISSVTKLEWASAKVFSDENDIVVVSHDVRDARS